MKPTLFAGVALSAMLTFCSLAYADILIGIGAPFSGDYSAFGPSDVLQGFPRGGGLLAISGPSDIK